ncbi:MAG: SDR family NAD(P)-dependent oxidoreductase, partial [Planctomycetota bacterium]|nr:SDR family NAD(P)-dependent oxidoreductase [Planctomycetota bacterium]
MMANRTEVAEPVALITGGSAGLGLAIAKHFSTSGYRVLLVGRKLELLESAKAKLSTACQSSVQAYACDVTEPGQVEELFEFVKSEFKQLDVLVNCVGESDRGLIEDLAPDRLQRLIEVN